MILGGIQNHESSWLAGISFALGAGCSILAGYIGMQVATKSQCSDYECSSSQSYQSARSGFAGDLSWAWEWSGWECLDWVLYFYLQQSWMGCA